MQDSQVKVQVQVSHKQAVLAHNAHPQHLDALAQKLTVAGAEYEGQWLTQVCLFQRNPTTTNPTQQIDSEIDRIYLFQDCINPTKSTEEHFVSVTRAGRLMEPGHAYFNAISSNLSEFIKASTLFTHKHTFTLRGAQYTWGDFSVRAGSVLTGPPNETHAHARVFVTLVKYEAGFAQKLDQVYEKLGLSRSESKEQQLKGVDEFTLLTQVITDF